MLDANLRNWIGMGKVATVKVDGYKHRRVAHSEIKRIRRISQLGKTRCRGCEQKKPLVKDGRCVECWTVYNREKNHSPERIEARLMRSFGITLADYEAMFEAQGGLCGICGKPERETAGGFIKRLAVDHDHKTGKVRGLLCSMCNKRLHALEFGDWTKRAKRYLKTHAR